MSLSNTRDKPSDSTLDTKSAGQSRTTHGFSEFSNQSVAGCDSHIHKSTTTSSLRNTATSRLHSTRGHFHATNLSGLSALGHHITNQAQADLVMQRYLSEDDKYKGFLVGPQDERSHESQVVAPDLEEWNHRWNEITQPRNNNQNKPKL